MSTSEVPQSTWVLSVVRVPGHTMALPVLILMPGTDDLYEQVLTFFGQAGAKPVTEAQWHNGSFSPVTGWSVHVDHTAGPPGQLTRVGVGDGRWLYVSPAQTLTDKWTAAATEWGWTFIAVMRPGSLPADLPTDLDLLADPDVPNALEACARQGLMHGGVARIVDDAAADASEAPAGASDEPTVIRPLVSLAVIAPDGALSWHSVDDFGDVEQLVTQGYAPTEGSWLGPSCPGLKLMASAVAMITPDRYPPNPVAQAVITALSEGYIKQGWAGHVAIFQHEDGFAEPMAREWRKRITELHAAATK